jgi:hypothetical protein
VEVISLHIFQNKAGPGSNRGHDLEVADQNPRSWRGKVLQDYENRKPAHFLKRGLPKKNPSADDPVVPSVHALRAAIEMAAVTPRYQRALSDLLGGALCRRNLSINDSILNPSVPGPTTAAMPIVAKSQPRRNLDSTKYAEEPRHHRRANRNSEAV